MLELIRRHAWSKEKRFLLYKYLDLKPNHIVVDVGCGTGAFSRVIAGKLDRSKGGRVIGVDRNSQLLKEGRKLADALGLYKVVSFKKSDVIRRIPLPDDYADRVVCQTFLWLMTDQDREKAIKEMIRVCKPNGLIGACEGAIDSSVRYIEGNERLSELLKKHSVAIIEGYKKLYGYDRTIGYKLATIFNHMGLERVRLDGIPHINLQCDDRVPLDYKIEEKKDSIKYPSQVVSKLERLRNVKAQRDFIEKAEPSLLAGGMTHEEIIEIMRLRKSDGERFLKDPELFEEDSSVDAGMVFITTGLKQARRQ